MNMGVGVKVKTIYNPEFLYFMHKRNKEHYTENMRKSKAEKRRLRNE